MGVPKSARLIEALREFPNLLIVTHDNPDPDAIAAGWTERCLLRERMRRTARLTGGGGTVRAENRHMLKLLNPPIELVDELTIEPGTAAVLVDCSSETANHLLSDSELQPAAVIDHHELGNGRRRRLAFRDIRPNVAASATIAAAYLREQEITPSKDLATALLYGITTETQGSETHYSPLDRRIIRWLAELADPRKLAEIRSAPLTRGYYGDLVLALQATFTYDDVALCFLPRADGAEIIGEVADLLVRCEEIERVLCAAIVEKDLLLSVRTDRDAGNAAELVQKTLKGLGLGGGHQHRAGGKILLSHCDCTTEQLYDQLRTRWLETCGVDRRRGTRLVAKREIVRNL